MRGVLRNGDRPECVVAVALLADPASVLLLTTLSLEKRTDLMQEKGLYEVAVRMAAEAQCESDFLCGLYRAHGSFCGGASSMQPLKSTAPPSEQATYRPRA